MDDVACSAGPTKISTVSNFAWVASDIAKRKVEKTLKPLIEQLKVRAVYIMKRLVDIVDKMVASTKMKKSAQGTNNKMGTVYSPPLPSFPSAECSSTSPSLFLPSPLQFPCDPSRALRGTCNPTDTRRASRRTS